MDALGGPGTPAGQGGREVKVAAQDERGWTALMQAACGPSEYVLDALLNSGADARIKNKEGKRALDYASYNKFIHTTTAYETLKAATLD